MHLSFLGVVCLLGLATAWPVSPPRKGNSGYVSTTYPQGPCQPNSRVKYLCNDCTCDRNGLGYTCTRRDCGNQGPFGPQISPPKPGFGGPQISPPRPNPGGPQISPPRPNPGGPQISPPRPNPGGPQVSPPRPYPEGPQISPPRPYPEGPQISPPRPQKCVPGTSFPSADGCNTCRCTSNGTPACTQRACLPIPPPPAKS